MKFPTCSAFQSVTFLDISYAFPVEDRAECHSSEGNVGI